MPLGLGTRLGPYEIVVAIGSGGMGEVYRATDINLGRQVAIKVLPRPSRKILSALLGPSVKQRRCRARLSGLQGGFHAKHYFETVGSL